MQDSDLLLQEKALTVRQIADYLQTTEESVLGMVHRGEIAASNINLKPNAQRPRWRVESSEFRRFLLRTRHQAAVDRPKPRRAKASSGKDYFA